MSASAGHSRRLHAMVAVQIRTALVTVVGQLWGRQAVVSHTQEGYSQVGNSRGRGEADTESERVPPSLDFFPTRIPLAPHHQPNWHFLLELPTRQTALDHPSST